MTSVNKVILIGHVGQSPDIKTFPSGGRVANFSLATSESWNDKATQTRKERTEWHRISVTNEALIKVVEQFVKKGSKLYLEGQLETRKFTTTQGAEKSVTEVVLRPYRGEIVLLDRKEDVATIPDGTLPGSFPTPQALPPAAVAAKADAPQRNPMEDEIPF